MLQVMRTMKIPLSCCVLMSTWTIKLSMEVCQGVTKILLLVKYFSVGVRLKHSESSLDLHQKDSVCR